MGEVYHITMLVTGEQEDTIRSLFKDKNWPCWFKVLSNENVASLLEGGFTYIFPVMEKEYRMGNAMFTEIKSEVLDVHDINVEHHDGLPLNASKDMITCFTVDNEMGNKMFTEIKTEVVDVDGMYDHQFINASKVIIPSCTVDNDDTLDYDLAREKSGLDLSDIKTENTPADATEDTIGNISGQTRDDEKNENKLNKKIKCTLCDTFYTTRTILKRHFKRRHEGMWFEFGCQDCSENFKTKEELWEHRRNNNHEPRKVLSLTSKELHTPEELIAMGHIKCEVCSNFYPHQRSLRRHMYKVHRDALPKWICGICGDEFGSRDGFWQHMRETQHKTSPSMLGNYQCDSCGKIYNRYDSFKEHKLSCLNVDRNPEELKNFPCDICGVMFKSIARVKSHKRGVHIVAPVVCHDCGATCKNTRALAVHRRRHDTKNRRYGCDDCGKTFFNNTLLTQHIRTHTKEKPYKCPMCNYRCAIKQNIHKHAQKVHKTNVVSSSPFVM